MTFSGRVRCTGMTPSPKTLLPLVVAASIVAPTLTAVEELSVKSLRSWSPT